MTVKEFIKGYNERCDWNKEMREEILGNIHESILKNNPALKLVFDNYIDVEKISEDNIDMDNAKIFDMTKSKTNPYVELQAYNFEVNGTMFYWLHPEESKKEYKERRLKYMYDVIHGKKENVDADLAKLKKEKENIDEALILIQNGRDKSEREV